MGTQVVRVGRDAEFASAVRAAVDALQAGGLVVFPTETVYGLAARADHPDAMRRLREVKTREAAKAFTVHIGSRDETARFVPRIPPTAQRLIRKGWPGPLTLILKVDDPRSAPVMADLNGEAGRAMYYGGTIGLRCPDYALAQTILREVDAPIVAASANLAGRPAPMTAEDALRDLGGTADVLIDDGMTRYGKPSTIVRVGEQGVEVVREGVYDERTVRRLAAVRFLFVCTGNTCRSPMAAALAGRILAERLGCEVDDLSDRGVVVTSAGTAGSVGGASEGAIDAMARRGLDLSGHRSLAVSPEMVQQADYVFTMTRAHREAVLRMSPAQQDRVHTLLDAQDVTDPLGGSTQDYEACAQTIERGLSARLGEVEL